MVMKTWPPRKTTSPRIMIARPMGASLAHPPNGATARSGLARHTRCPSMVSPLDGCRTRWQPRHPGVIVPATIDRRATMTAGSARCVAAIGAALLILGAARPAAANEESFAGKRIQMVIGWDVGGGYDVYARLLARHLGKHIPGSPTIVPQNMPGAGSRVAANWLYNIAPKDGTAIATIGQGTPLDQAMNEPSVRYDAAKLNWIGNPIMDNLVTAVTQHSGVETLDDLKKKGEIGRAHV